MSASDELYAALRNIRMAAASGRVYGHGATDHDELTIIARKDKALDQILSFCEAVGVVGSILRESKP